MKKECGTVGTKDDQLVVMDSGLTGFARAPE
jgi:hypothetical protein